MRHPGADGNALRHLGDSRVRHGKQYEVGIAEGISAGDDGDPALAKAADDGRSRAPRPDHAHRADHGSESATLRPMRRLSLQDARRLTIIANQLAGPRPSTLLEVVERLCRVQVDPTSAVERAEEYHPSGYTVD